MMLAHDIVGKKEDIERQYNLTIGVRYMVWFVK